jgi:WD40 repeat protein
MRLCCPVGELRRLLVGSVVLGVCMLLGEVHKGTAQTKVGLEEDTPLAVAFSPRGTEVAAAGFGGAVKIWTPPGVSQRTIPGPNRSTRRAIAFSPDGKLLAVGGDDGSVHIFDVGTGKSVHTFAGHIGHVLALVFAPDGRTLATAAMKYELMADKRTPKFTSEVCFWDVALKRRNQTWVLSEGVVPDIAYSPDGKALAVAGRKVEVREVNSGQVIGTFKPEKGGVWKVAFSPDGKNLSGGGGYSVPVNGGSRSVGELRVWDVSTGKVQFTKTDLPGRVESLAYSPDGRAIATGGGGPWREAKGGGGWLSSEIRVWDAGTGALTYSVEGKSGKVHSLAFSPDGATIVWCDHEEIVITDASTGSRRGTLMTVSRQIMKEKSR